MRNVTILGCWSFSVVASLPCYAAELTSPEGFTLVYPDTWVVPSAEETDKVRKLAQPTLDRGGLPHPGPFVLIVGPVEDGFAVNVTVFVDRRNTDLNEDEWEWRHKELIPGVVAKAGIVVSDVRTERISVNGRSAFSLWCDLKRPQSGTIVREWHVVIPVGAKNYSVNCVVPRAAFDKYEGTLRSIVNSIKIRGGCFDFWFALPTRTQKTILFFAFAACIGAAFIALRRRRKPPMLC